MHQQVQAVKELRIERGTARGLRDYPSGHRRRHRPQHVGDGNIELHMGGTPEVEEMVQREGAERRIVSDGFVIIPQHKLVAVHRPKDRQRHDHQEEHNAPGHPEARRACVPKVQSACTHRLCRGGVIRFSPHSGSMTLSLCLCSSHGRRERCAAKRATSSRAEPERHHHRRHVGRQRVVEGHSIYRHPSSRQRPDTPTPSRSGRFPCRWEQDNRPVRALRSSTFYPTPPVRPVSTPRWSQR